MEIWNLRYQNHYHLTSIPRSLLLEHYQQISGANLTGITDLYLVNSWNGQTLVLNCDNETVIFDSNWAKINDSSVIVKIYNTSSGLYIFTTGIYLVTFTTQLKIVDIQTKRFFLQRTHGSY